MFQGNSNSAPTANVNVLSPPKYSANLSQANYYLSIEEVFVTGVHCEMFRALCPDQDRCFVTAKKVMSKGEELQVNHMIKIPTSRMVRYGDSLVLEDILWSCAKDCPPDRFGKIYMYPYTNRPGWNDLSTTSTSSYKWGDGIYPTSLYPGIKCAARFLTDFSSKTPNRDFRKFIDNQEVWYLIEYELVIKFPTLEFEVFFKGERITSLSSLIPI